MVVPFVEKHCIQGGSNFPTNITIVAKWVMHLVNMSEYKLFSLMAKIACITKPTLGPIEIEVIWHHCIYLIFSLTFGFQENL